MHLPSPQRKSFASGSCESTWKSAIDKQINVSRTKSDGWIAEIPGRDAELRSRSTDLVWLLKRLVRVRHSSHIYVDDILSLDCFSVRLGLPSDGSPAFCFGLP